MNQEILEAIQKTLPAMQMEALRSELSKASEHKSLMEKLENERQESNRLRSSVRDLEKKNSELQVMLKSQEEFEKLVRDYEITKTKHELLVQQSVNNDFRQFVNLIVKNPVYTQTSQVPIYIPKDNYGNGGYMSSQTVTSATELTK